VTPAPLVDPGSRARADVASRRGHRRRRDLAPNIVAPCPTGTPRSSAEQPCRAQKPHPRIFSLVGPNGTLPAAAIIGGGMGDTMDGVGDRGAPQAEGAAGRGEPLFATATHRPPASAATAAVASCRSAILDPSEATVFRLARRAAHCPARDGLEMAPRR